MTTAPTVAWEERAGLVIVGGGVAGLTAARAAASLGVSPLVLAKGGPTDTATQYAQGGVAVLADDETSVDSHVADTLAAGGGLCDEPAVREILAAGPDAVARAVAAGVVFDRGPDGRLARTREGGHSRRRILHAGGDATGAELQRALLAGVGAGRTGIATSGSVRFGTTVLRVVTEAAGVTGILAHDSRGYGVIHAPAVILATGGLGQLYTSSTNPAGATGDGLALALDAGAAVADLEFVQFHPTVLYVPGAAGAGRRPLVSEAVRGEGARLIDGSGRGVTDGVHPLGDLAPRDVVSRAIHHRMAETGSDHVYLDARHLDGFAERFPTVTASCRAAGIDSRSDLIPVAPAAHYSCGGVVTDTFGRTQVPGLYAAGEVARTGLHGANRLASNSLLEGLVVGERAGTEAAGRAGIRVTVREAGLPHRPVVDRPTLQAAMTAHASVVRDAAGLTVVHRLLESGSVGPRTVHEIEDAALTVAATALVTAASARRESVGCHTRSDGAGPSPAPRRSETVPPSSMTVRLRDGRIEIVQPQLTGAL
ncbi:L-aspartate oxidase [Rhodococcus triatomae]|uniref:L-aspartate oxidase n=1 Tax=Rhodococcus triatomae TaxID=300028 RepID=A0A1G8CVX2_9NOCA|nr:L-aspartate oxidase [Rhodococcus triatomae]QNG18565.1 L-aspartate oxidase [Rhodococcus triatomae]QNG21766.1 L-aspartate oxidase [Rhodococcus triatomae]SDH49687.1 L-aspartate oxidase [Rhodococcus triatomae]